MPSVPWLAVLAGAAMWGFEAALLTQTRVSFRLGPDILPYLALYAGLPLAATLAGGLLAARRGADSRTGQRAGLLSALSLMVLGHGAVAAYLELTPLSLPMRETGTAAFVASLGLAGYFVWRRRPPVGLAVGALVALWCLAVALHRAPRQIVVDLLGNATGYLVRDGVRALALVAGSVMTWPLLSLAWRRPRLGLPLALTGAAAVVFSVTPPAVAPVSPAAPPRGDVFVIIVDALRADHTTPEDTPVLSALAARGLSFADAHSPSIETQYSLPVMLDQYDGQGHGRPKLRWNAARPSWPTSLPGRLAAAGYRLHLFSDFAYLALDGLEVYRWDTVAARAATFFRLASMLPAWHAMFAREWESLDYVVNDRQPYPDGEGPADALERLLATDPPPGFHLIHLGAPHEPYDYPPYEADTLPPLDRAQYEAQLRRFGREMGLVRHDDLAAYQLLYRRAVRGADEELGRLLDVVARHGRDREALVVVTADHGESLGEGGYLAHGLTLHAREHHVPLVIAGPDVPAARVTRPVTGARLADTVASWARLPGGGDASLLAEASATGPSAPVVVWTPQAVKVMHEGWRLVWTHDEALLERPTAWGHRRAVELYDGARDPDERRDVYREGDVRAEALLALARRLRAEAP